MEPNLFYYPLIQELTTGKKSLTNNPLSNEFLRNLYLVIEDNIDDSLLNVSFLARRLAVSKSTLNRRLSMLVGLSANEIIKQHRLQKAAIFLMSGKNVSETAYLTGFETPSYFTQCFKEMFKVTPKAYAKLSYSYHQNKNV
jgi:AraC-like DNA-binding protein